MCPLSSVWELSRSSFLPWSLVPFNMVSEPKLMELRCTLIFRLKNCWFNLCWTFNLATCSFLFWIADLGFVILVIVTVVDCVCDRFAFSLSSLRLCSRLCLCCSSSIQVLQNTFSVSIEFFLVSFCDWCCLLVCIWESSWDCSVSSQILLWRSKFHRFHRFRFRIKIHNWLELLLKMWILPWIRLVRITCILMRCLVPLWCH